MRITKDILQSLNKKKIKEHDYYVGNNEKNYCTYIYYKFSDTVENAVQMHSK